MPRYNALLGVVSSSLKQALLALRGAVVMSPDLEALTNSLQDNAVRRGMPAGRWGRSTRRQEAVGLHRAPWAAGKAGPGSLEPTNTSLRAHCCSDVHWALITALPWTAPHHALSMSPLAPAALLFAGAQRVGRQGLPLVEAPRRLGGRPARTPHVCGRLGGARQAGRLLDLRPLLPPGAPGGGPGRGGGVARAAPSRVACVQRLGPRSDHTA